MMQGVIQQQNRQLKHRGHEEEVVVNGKSLPKYSRQQLEAMNKEIIRIRAMNIRDAMESLEVPPPHFGACVEWILAMQEAAETGMDYQAPVINRGTLGEEVVHAAQMDRCSTPYLAEGESRDLYSAQSRRDANRGASIAKARNQGSEASSAMNWGYKRR